MLASGANQLACERMRSENSFVCVSVVLSLYILGSCVEKGMMGESRYQLSVSIWYRPNFKVSNYMQRPLIPVTVAALWSFYQEDKWCARLSKCFISFLGRVICIHIKPLKCPLKWQFSMFTSFFILMINMHYFYYMNQSSGGKNCTETTELCFLVLQDHIILAHCAQFCIRQSSTLLHIKKGVISKGEITPLVEKGNWDEKLNIETDK